MRSSFGQATGEIVGRTPETTAEEMRAAVASNHKAFQTWREISVSTRIRYMFNLQQLVQKNQDELARLIVKEQGKTFADAKVRVLGAVYALRAIDPLGRATSSAVSRSSSTLALLALWPWARPSRTCPRTSTPTRTASPSVFAPVSPPSTSPP